MYKVQVLLLCSATRLDSFSSTLQPYPWQGTHATLVWAITLMWPELTLHVGLEPSVCPPYVASPNFTPWYGEAHMEFTSCSKMLHSQPTGSTEIRTHDLHIQSPLCYPLGHHLHILHTYAYVCTDVSIHICMFSNLFHLPSFKILVQAADHAATTTTKLQFDIAATITHISCTDSV